MENTVKNNVLLCNNHFTVQQKLTQHCKSTVLHLKKILAGLYTLYPEGSLSSWKRVGLKRWNFIVVRGQQRMTKKILLIYLFHSICKIFSSQRPLKTWSLALTTSRCAVSRMERRRSTAEPGSHEMTMLTTQSETYSRLSFNFLYLSVLQKPVK